jgi:tetratricopeptide (TPR) repeat protein
MLRHFVGFELLAATLLLISLLPLSAAVAAVTGNEPAGAENLTESQRWHRDFVSASQMATAGKLTEAEGRMREVVAAVEGNPDRKEDLGLSLAALGRLYHQMARYEEASQRLERALPLLEGAAVAATEESSRARVRLANTLNNLASVYQDMGKLTPAEKMYRRCLRILGEARGEEHPDLTRPLNNLAALYRKMGKIGKARELSERVLLIRERELGVDAIETARIRNNLGQIEQIEGEYAAAERHYLRAVETWQSQRAEDDPDAAATWNNLAVVHRAMGKREQAHKELDRAMEIWSRNPGKEHPFYGKALINRAALYMDAREYDKAHESYREALQIFEQAFGDEHPVVGAALNGYAFLLHKMKRKKESKAVEQRAAAILQDHPELTTTRHTVDWTDLHSFRSADGEPKKGGLLQRW